MASDFETPLTPPAAPPAQAVTHQSGPQVPIAPQNFASPAGTYFGESAYPAPQQHTQSTYQIVNVYQNAPVVRPTNGMAIGSLVTGFFGMFPVSIPLGITALNRIKQTGEPGRWQAITGIVMGSFHALMFATMTLPALIIALGT